MLKLQAMTSEDGEFPGQKLDRKSQALERIPATKVEIGAINYGKLVTSATGHVARGHDYEITRQTTGLGKLEQVSPLKIFGFLPKPLHFKTEQGNLGALALRNLPGGSIVAQRARYRPEAGEGRPGRPYLQANALVFSSTTWARHASQLSTVLSELRAEPDLVTTPSDQRKNIAPAEVALEAHDVPRPEAAGASAVIILNYLRSDVNQPLKVSREICPTEFDFLKAIGTAIEILRISEPSKTVPLHVISGLADDTSEQIGKMPVRAIIY